MFLADYVGAVLSDDDQGDFPSSLQLSHRMVVRFKILLQKGIKEKKELGYAFHFNESTGEIRYSHLCTGSSHGITLPCDNSKENFGCVHCHPSLRYKNGAPAHSPTDVIAFKDNASKPLFISLVASSEAYVNYALVARKGVTTYKQDVVNGIMRATPTKLLNYYDTHRPVKKEVEDELMYNLSIAKTATELRLEKQRARARGRIPPKTKAPIKGSRTDAIEELITELQRKTPGFGPYGERVSINNMKTVVEECKFAFYRSVRVNPRNLVRYQW